MSAQQRAAPGAGRGRAPVMADVADLARVSQQTVSRVANGSDLVRPQTRERVLAAMRELGYRPNSAARALATGRSRTVGVVSFDTTLYGPASTQCAVARAAHQAGYAVMVASLEALDGASVAQAIQRLRADGVSGAIVIAPQRDGAAALLDLPFGAPVVAVEAGLAGPVSLVTVDQTEGAVMATRHLLELGHRTVWHVAGPQDWLEAELRVEGWRSTLIEADAVVPPVLVGDWGAQSGYEAGLELADRPGVTAVFVSNDSMALGVLRAMREAGRAIPEEVSLLGFDDIPEAQYFAPPLTTVRQDFVEVGRRSLELLLKLMEGDGEASSVAIAPRLIVRGSTAPPSQPR